MSDCNIIFISENCIQCRGCEVACKTWRNVDIGVTWRKIETHWEGSGLDSKCVATSFACQHCVDAPCMDACSVGAIDKDSFTGIVLVDKDVCTGCRACLPACPHSVPQYGNDGKMQKCDLCFSVRNSYGNVPLCVATCPTKALQVSNSKNMC